MAEDKASERQAQDRARPTRQHTQDLTQPSGATFETVGSPPQPSLLGDSRLAGRGNGPVLISAMQRAQRYYGNRAVQRFIQRQAGIGAQAGAVAGRAAQAQEGGARDRVPAGTTGTHRERGQRLQRYVVYEDHVKVGGTIAWRNNNPGNIERGGFAESQGGLPTNGRFAVFPDVETGASAISALLKDRYGTRTIRQTMERYAPRSENNTEAYIAHIVQHTGLRDDRTIESLSNDELASMVAAIRSREGVVAGTVYRAGDESAPQWVRALLGQ